MAADGTYHTGAAPHLLLSYPLGLPVLAGTAAVILQRPQEDVGLFAGLALVAGLATVVAPCLVVAPATALAIIESEVTKDRALRTIIAALAFIALFSANHLFFWMPVRLQRLYYLLFPGVLAVVASAPLIGFCRILLPRGEPRRARSPAFYAILLPSAFLSALSALVFLSTFAIEHSSFWMLIAIPGLLYYLSRAALDVSLNLCFRILVRHPHEQRKSGVSFVLIALLSAIFGIYDFARSAHGFSQAVPAAILAVVLVSFVATAALLAAASDVDRVLQRGAMIFILFLDVLYVAISKAVVTSPSYMIELSSTLEQLHTVTYLFPAALLLANVLVAWRVGTRQLAQRASR